MPVINTSKLIVVSAWHIYSQLKSLQSFRYKRCPFKNEALPESSPFIMVSYDRMSGTVIDRPKTSFVKLYAERSYIIMKREKLSRRKKADKLQ